MVRKYAVASRVAAPAIGFIAGIWILVGSSSVVGANAKPPASEQGKALRSPIPDSQKSIDRGKFLFDTSGCTNCHGRNGKALSQTMGNATDLTNPNVWRNGTAEGQIFRSISDGAGNDMPGFKDQLTSMDIWNLVNFIRSLWPSNMKPAVVPEKH